MFFEDSTKTFTKHDQLQFFDVVSNYVHAGISPTDAVRLYRESIEKEMVAYAVSGKLIRFMQNGMDFAESLKRFPEIFPAYAIGLLEVAQKTGQLPAMLSEIVAQMEQELDIASRIKRATFIPKISSVGIILVFFLGSTYIIPQLGNVLLDMNIDLPLITKIVLTLGNGMASLWWLCLLVLGAAGCFYFQFKKQHPDQYSWIIMNLPLWKPVAFNRLKYNFCKVMGLCTSAGIKPSQALSYTALAIDNAYMRNTIKRSLKHIQNGMAIDKAIKKEDTYEMLDTSLYVMLQTGASLGNLGDIMKKQADNYKKKLDTAVAAIGDKIGITVLVPCYIAIVIMFAAIEYPVITMGANMSTSGM